MTNLNIVTRSIVGLKKEESEALLEFLYQHIARGVDYQARVRWAPKTVVVWDVSPSIFSRSSNRVANEMNRTVSPSTPQPLIGQPASVAIWHVLHLKLRTHMRLHMSRRFQSRLRGMKMKQIND
jgi:hypothetical protein